MYLRLQLVFFVLFLGLSSFGFAQTRLTGKILNNKNEPIVGVSIKITGTQAGTTSDVEGRYSLSLAAGKKYELEFSASGFSTKLVNDIEAGPGLDNELNIVLEIAVTNIEGVTVRATSRRQESTNALLAFQKNNISLSSGLAADFIRRTPDKNTGEILKRVSGASIQDNKFVIVRGLSDRYNAAQINSAPFPSTEPDKKAFSFDVIPAVLIDNIIINKTATPELSGEFAGGLVQINTKDIPTKDILNVGVSFGFNTNSAFKDFISNERGSRDWLGFDDGNRDLPAGIPSTASGYNGKNVIGRAALSKLFRSDVYPQVNSKAAPIQTYSITYGLGRKFKNNASFGLVAGIIYRSSKLKYSVDRLIGEKQIDAINRQFIDEQNKYAVNIGSVLNLTYLFRKTKISFKNLVNQSYEDNYYTRTGNDFDRQVDVDFRSSFLNQRTLYTGQLEAEQQLTRSGIKLKLNGNLAYNWKTQPDLRTTSYFKSIGSGDPFRLSFDESGRFFSDLKDYSYGGGGQLIVPFTAGKEKQTFKTGGSTLIRIRNFRSRNFRWEAGSSDADNQRALPFDQIFQPQNISENGFLLEEITQLEDKYFGVSIVNAGYLMFDNKLSEKIRLIWGVRAENFQQVLTAKRSDLKRIVVDTDKWDILPSVNFVYNINTKNIIRVSGSQTVARPEFREIAPFSFFDFEQNYAVSGDTTLTRTRIYNADVRYELYPKAGESISIGLFYKKFDDPIELRARNSNPRRYSYQNADKASSYGVELEVRKGLDFIGKSLENFSVFSNLTYISSKVELKSITSGGQSVSFDRPLQGQSPYLINLGLQYANKNADLSGTLLYNRVGQRIALVGDVDQLGLYDIYERPRDQVDFQLSKKIFKKRGEIKLNISDILNQKYYFYDNIDSKKAFKNGADRLFYSYKPGATYTISFTYDFIK
jgi:hypothetical protein